MTAKDQQAAVFAFTELFVEDIHEYPGTRWGILSTTILAGKKYSVSNECTAPLFIMRMIDWYGS